MDAEHRHELKSNELAGFLDQLPDFFRKYSNQILGVCLILIALVVIPVYKRMRQQTTLADQAAVVSKIQTARESVSIASQDTQNANPGSLLSAAATDLKDAAETTKYANLAALALLEEAELLRAELHIRKDVSADTISANLSRAKIACEQALEKAQTPTLKGLAELGLGLCAEEGGQYDQARAIYTKIIQTTEYDGTAVIEQAQRRLDSLDDNAVKVTFVKAPEPPAETAPEAQATQTPAVPAEVVAPAPAPAAPAAP
jgi:predicted negative regulator of RcsB-dependent stress response